MGNLPTQGWFEEYDRNTKRLSFLSGNRYLRSLKRVMEPTATGSYTYDVGHHNSPYQFSRLGIPTLRPHRTSAEDNGLCEFRGIFADEHHHG